MISIFFEAEKISIKELQIVTIEGTREGVRGNNDF